MKPNDRGKDVLSLVTEVDPRNAKDRQKIEKLYSGFLGLDQRMRNAIGKHMAKKMGRVARRQGTEGSCTHKG